LYYQLIKCQIIRIGTIAEAGEHNHSFINYIQSGSNSGSGGEAAGYFKLQILEMQVFILTI
jgi:hypothetical protein